MRLIQHLLVSILFIIVSLTGFGQKNFEGEVTYSISYEKIPQEMASVIDHLPTQLVVKYQGDMKKEEIISPKSSKITITDLQANTSYVLMTLFGEKIALIEEGQNKKMQELAKSTKVERTETTKVIGEFTAHQALLHVPQLENPLVLFFTDKYTVSDNDYNVEGLPLEFKTIENGMLITYTMVSLEEKSFKIKEFEVDKSYKILTPEELQQQFGME